MTRIQCQDNLADRAIGRYWEERFLDMAISHGQYVTLHQVDRKGAACAIYLLNGKREKIILPDATGWNAISGHHEIKHKDPCYGQDHGHGEFGLECYRWDSLIKFRKLTNHNVYYTIHNHKLNVGDSRNKRKSNEDNNPDHWVTAHVDLLDTYDSQIIQ